MVRGLKKPTQVQHNHRDQDERDGGDQESLGAQARAFPFAGHQAKGVGEEDAPGSEQHVTYRGSGRSHQCGADAVAQDPGDPQCRHEDGQNGLPARTAPRKEMRRPIPRQKINAIDQVGNESGTQNQSPQGIGGGEGACTVQLASRDHVPAKSEAQVIERAEDSGENTEDQADGKTALPGCGPSLAAGLFRLAPVGRRSRKA